MTMSGNPLALLLGGKHPTRDEVERIADALDKEVRQTKQCIDALQETRDPLKNIAENVWKLRQQRG